MGKLDHDPHIQHFSHPHPLELSNFQENIITQNSPLCSSCKYPQSGYMYSCNICNFHIHLSCTQFPQLITHPSHPTHALTLLPVSNYPGGQFNCDACNCRGNGFSYHCHHCDFDLHVVCASKPLSIIHQSHAHTLGLAFRNPYETKGFSCDICKKIGSKQWLYRCGACEFDAHLECATGTQPPPPPVPPPKPVAQPPQLLQTHHSFPAANVQQNQFQTPVAGRLNNYYAHSASTGSLLQQPVQPLLPPAPQQQGYTAAGANSSMGSGLMNAVFQGLVEGAAQQVGQNVMKSLNGGGGGGSGSGGGNGDGDGSSGSIFVDVGPSYVIEDSSESPSY